MRYTGIQPQYFPRLHYFARILSADIFVIRDDVQFVRKHRYPDGSIGKSYQVHTPLKQPNGVGYLTVPVIHDGRKTIAETDISYETSWIEDHLKTIQFAYHKSPSFASIHLELGHLLSQKYKSIAELNTATILWGILRLLGEKEVTPDKLSIAFVEKKLHAQNRFRLRHILYESSTATAKERTHKNERIIALCKELGATEDYCGGTATAAYVDPLLFKNAGIKITVQDWKSSEYKQRYSKIGFLGNLSIIDLLMNASHDESVKIILGKKSTISNTPSSLWYLLPTLETELLISFSDLTGVFLGGLISL
jgi:hypothetical protein